MTRADIWRALFVAATASACRAAGLEGKVADADGWSVAGAEVALGAPAFGASPRRVWTDAQGRFAFPNPPPGHVLLTVTAPGCAPAMQWIAPAAGLVVVRLGRGRALRGQVIDERGGPLSGVNVWVERWRGFRTLSWRGRTDQDGWFEWRAAPADGAVFRFYKPGCMAIQGKRLRPGKRVHVLVMRPALRVSGTVVDADTGEPLPSFRVIPGELGTLGGEVRWRRAAARVGKDGRYELVFVHPAAGHLIRVEAQGYAPDASRAFRNDERSPRFDFRLRKAEGVRGVVLGADGKPLPGARVVVATRGEPLVISDGALPPRPACAAVADAAGRFRLPAQDAQFAVLTAHERGVGLAQCSPDTRAVTVTAQPWSRVDARVNLAGRPRAGDEVILRSDQLLGQPATLVSFAYSGVTDEAGRVAFERIPPGRWLIARRVSLGWPLSFMLSHARRAAVRPGETLRVTLGGGRPVVGRFAAPAGRALRVSEWRWRVWLQPRPSRAALAKLAQTLGTPEEPLDAAGARRFVGRVSDDGTFRIDGAPPGSYVLLARFTDPGQGPFAEGARLLAYARKEVVVPTAEKPTAFDLGAVPLTFVPRPRVGRPAPDFQARTLDGRTFRLSAQRGKLVALHFCAAWAAKGRGPFAELKGLYDAADGRLVILGVHVGESEEEAARWTKALQLPWPQTCAALAPPAPLLRGYGVLSPDGEVAWLGGVLIGPDGRILADRVSDDELPERIEAALAAKK